MGSLLVFQTIFLSYSFLYVLSSCEFVYPNFTASNFQFVDHAGAFLFSRNGTFKAAIFNPGAQQTSFYLCIIHVASNIVIWSANRDTPISKSGKMMLTVNGLTMIDQDGSLKWSTPALQSSASALVLTDDGNLVLLDQFNDSLWESFHYPTDTIVMGQSLPVGSILSSGVSSYNLSTGDYMFVITSDNAIMQWRGLTYWKLSTETNAYTNSNYPVEFMAINNTGFYLFGRNGSVVVIQVILSHSHFRVAKLDNSGQFIVGSFSGSNWNQEFLGPVDECQIPFICGRIGLCADSTLSNTPVCSCPSGFQADPQNTSSCAPSDVSYSLPVACNSTNDRNLLNSSTFSYIGLGYGMKYFAIDFLEPVKYGVDLSVCEDLCSGDCRCLGIFYENSSGSCYMLENELGSIMSRSTSKNSQLGYIKLQIGALPADLDHNDRFSNRGKIFPIIDQVVLPIAGFFLLVALGFLWWRRRRLCKARERKLGYPYSPSSGERDAFSIPGLPLRFEYKELEMATDNFRTHIGSGGFGAVYKGTLHDNTVVAVKKITNLGIQGKKEFYTEIAVIGNIHHVNLVKLRGFCAQGRQRLLVYEYMNRGSLDRTLFGSGPVLVWQDRFDIVLGTARGLAYLHSGCEHKIIHCDIKPENILLHDHLQAKISDFGLSKLLSPEQSSLFTTMRGTRGYLAPEWLTSCAISEKTDVYSFGMVLLEILSGRKNCFLRTQSYSVDDNNSCSGHSTSLGSKIVYFPLFALEMHEKGRYLELADPRLEGRVESEEVEKLVRVALCCVHEDPALRPDMATVVGMLEGGIPLVQPRMESLNFLRFYGRRFTEASTIAGGSEQHNFMIYPRANASLTSMTSGSHASFSYVSSQQISGPR
ncbi:G-type lectin S-receptor-like serine/threonine-protein kinase At5g35370 [Malania oleifera]|uniref:G-type lectin S-receptor-like serine/threonine-protein kinase At5g35370 n=1 Tax=Malania oleifera TaxID=397392 RepID=UPI0025AE6638|nr:G-type lectin S-receptor-like serine/threonine-protein kinase At5g35370 [Malania oleifera]